MKRSSEANTGKLGAGVIAISLAGLFSGPAIAQEGGPGGAEAMVIQVADGELLLDRGAGDGVKPGMAGDLFTLIAIIHPVTQRSIKDLVPLAKAQVKSVGAVVSVATVPDELLVRVKVGDVVKFAGLQGGTRIVAPPQPVVTECPPPG